MGTYILHINKQREDFWCTATAGKDSLCNVQFYCVLQRQKAGGLWMDLRTTAMFTCTRAQVNGFHGVGGINACWGGANGII